MANLGADAFRRRLARALRVGGSVYGPQDILKAVEEGRMQSWTKNESLVVTELMTFPQASALNVVLAVGELDDVMSLQQDIKEFGRAQGAKVMRMEGREGWGAVLPEYGWNKVPHVIYELEL
jgi:hypothetical protein